MGNTISLFEQHTYAINSDGLVKEGVWGVPMNKVAFEKQMEEVSEIIQGRVNIYVNENK